MKRGLKASRANGAPAIPIPNSMKRGLKSHTDLLGDLRVQHLLNEKKIESWRQ